MHLENFEKETLDALCLPISYHPSDGELIGEHHGAHYFTIGQRKGLQVGGTGKPLFVIATDTKENLIYTGLGEDHPGLNRNGLFVVKKDIHWIREDLMLPVGASARYQARIRYRQPLVWATLIMRDHGLYVIFDEAQRGIAPGQFVAWYKGVESIGSGVIC
jgi:tRNA-specific 2-thiouridylase